MNRMCYLMFWGQEMTRQWQGDMDLTRTLCIDLAAAETHLLSSFKKSQKYPQQQFFFSYCATRRSVLSCQEF